MQQGVVVALVVLLTLSIGLRTDPRDFQAALRRPGVLWLAILVNLGLVPLLALAVAAFAPLPPPILTGFVLCAVCPGGPSGPLFASRAGGDLAIAVTATIGLSLLGVVSAPLTLSRVLGVAIELDLRALVAPMIGILALCQLLPLIVGMVVRRRWPEPARRIARPAEWAANALLIAVILGLLIARGEALVVVGGPGLAVAAGMVVVTLALGALTSREPRVRRSIALVTGVRNISLALLVSATLLPDPLVDAAVLAYGLFTMALPFAAARLLSPKRGAMVRCPSS